MELSDPHRVPLISPPPSLDEARPLGPITLKQRAFFAAAIKPKRMPHPELSGVIVVERTSQAWLAAAGVAVLATFVIAALAIDRSSAADALTKSEADIAALKAAAAAAAAAPVVDVKAAKAAPAPAPATAAAPKLDAKAIVDALTAKLGPELKRGDAKIVVEDARVKLVMGNALLFDGKQTNLARRGEDVVARVGDALDGVDGKIDVVAHTDRTAGRGESEWSKSAARSTSVVRYLADKTKVDSKRLFAVARGNVEHGRRVEIIVSK